MKPSAKQESGVNRGKDDEETWPHRYLRSLDLFGCKPELEYGGESTCKSPCGGLVTLLVMMSYLFITLLTTWRYFQREAPATNINKEYVGDPKGMQLTNDSLPIAFGLQDVTTKHFIDPTIYNLTVTYRRTIKEMVGGQLVVKTSITKLLDLIPCSEANLDNRFATHPLVNMFCLKDLAQPGYDLTVTGEFESNDFGLLIIRIFRCQGPTCKSDADIESKLANSYFAINYLNRLIKSSNYSDPIHTYPDSFFTPTSINLQKKIVMRLVDHEVVTQSSLTGYTDPKVEKTTIVDQFVTDIGELRLSGNPPPSPFVMISIRMGRMKTVTVRTYKTIYNYLAEFGGLSQLIVIAIFALTRPWLRRHLYFHLAQRAAFTRRFYQNAVDKINVPHKNTSSAAKLENFGHQSPIIPLDSSNIIEREQPSMFSPPPPGHSTNNFSPGKSRIFPAQAKDKLMAAKSAVVSKPEQVGVPPHPPQPVDAAPQSQSSSKSIWLLKRNSKQLDMGNSPSNAIPVRTDKILAKSSARIGHQPFEIVQGKDGDSGQINHDKSHKQAYTNFAGSNSYKLFFHTYFFCLKKKKTTDKEDEVEIITQSMRRKLDVFKLIDLYEDMQKLKWLILDPSQRVLFDAIPDLWDEHELSPHYSLQRDMHAATKDIHFSQNNIQNMHLPNGYLEEIIGACQDIQQRRERTSMDDKLMHKVSPLPLVPPNVPSSG